MLIDHSSYVARSFISIYYWLTKVTTTYSTTCTTPGKQPWMIKHNSQLVARMGAYLGHKLNMLY